MLLLLARQVHHHSVLSRLFCFVVVLLNEEGVIGFIFMLWGSFVILKAALLLLQPKWLLVCERRLFEVFLALDLPDQLFLGQWLSCADTHRSLWILIRLRITLLGLLVRFVLTIYHPIMNRLWDLLFEFMFSLLQASLTNRSFDLVFTAQFDFLFLALVLFGLLLVLIFD